MNERPKCGKCRRINNLCPACQAAYDREEAMTDAELDSLIAEQLPTMPKGPEDRISPFRGGFSPRFTAPVRATERRAR